MTLERYYFVADRANSEYDSAILHAERNCHHIDELSEDRLAVVSADGAELRESGLFLQCLHCTDGEDGVVPD
jgi:hypothetical protein